MRRAWNWLALAAVGLIGCSDGGETEEPEETVEACFDTTVDASLCDPASATFSLGSTNVYYPLVVGDRVVLEGTEDGVLLRVEREVLATTKVVAGVETHILEHKSYEDGEIHEIALNYYVEASDGTVCYFGEDVEFYEGGMLANTDGTWRADDPGAKPGVIMPASPTVGQTYFQENAKDSEAWDMGRVSMTDASVTFGAQMLTGVLTIQDSNPFDGCEEETKQYAPGIGEVKDVALELIAFTPAGS